MRRKRSYIGPWIAMGFFMLCGLISISSQYWVVGFTSSLATPTVPLQIDTNSGIPSAIVADAQKTADGLFRSEDQTLADVYAARILAVYDAVKNDDVVILFNSGGWGEHPVKDSPGWQSILSGIQTELNISGYDSVVTFNYVRTDSNWSARLGEMQEMQQNYPVKAVYLAEQVKFLLRHCPDIMIILTGESTGTILPDETRRLIGPTNHVYAILTGPPFWHRPNSADPRVLVMKDNGIVPDSFSQGNVWVIFRENIKSLLRISSEVDEGGGGDLFNSMKAPGHVYWWQYPQVSGEITDFLEKNFGVKVTNSN